MKVVLIVLDSVGIGEAPDASAYGDVGAATLQHAAGAVGGLHVPHLESLGLGRLPGLLPNGLPVAGVTPVDHPRADYGAMREVSEGKDTITGHWEIAGLEMKPGFTTFPPDHPSFPTELTEPFAAQTGRGILANRAASGTRIIQELGARHMKSGDFIVYTSGDSVFQIAAHVDVVPLEELYEACRIARALCNPYRVGRVIARPFAGKPGAFVRTRDRRDFAFEADEPTILERLVDAGHRVYTVGKIVDIFNGKGITESDHTGGNTASQAAVERFVDTVEHGLIFANFIDFDMLYGHRRDPEGYAACVEQTDRWLGTLLPNLGPDDVLVITADHGNDPTFTGTDHTREYVPLLVYRPGKAGRALGVRHGFFDIAQSLATLFGLPPHPRGLSFC